MVYCLSDPGVLKRLKRRDNDRSFCHKDIPQTVSVYYRWKYGFRQKKYVYFFDNNWLRLTRQFQCNNQTKFGIPGAKCYNESERGYMSWRHNESLVMIVYPYWCAYFHENIFLYPIMGVSLMTGSNRPISHILECTCSISHNAPFRTEMCTFLFWMEHCGIWNRCILGFVN